MASPGGIELAAFLGVSLAVILSPGQDTALTIRNTLLGGRRGGVATAFGVVTGQLTWTLATSAGIAALVAASEPAFVALKLAGVAYLLYLGGRSLAVALRPGDFAGPGPAGAAAARLLAPRAAYRQGLISNLGNPKVAVFFTSLLPQFVPAGGAAFVPMIALGATFAAITLAWLSLYAVVVARAGDALRRPRVRRVLEGMLGGVLVVLGVRLALSGRP